jgi:hypothetical protein
MLGRIAAASLALGAGGEGTVSATFPVETLAEWVESELENEPRTTPLRALATADRAAISARQTVAALWPNASEAFVKFLARDESGTVRIGAAAALGRILELASPAERIEIVCRWTVSGETCERLAVARALGLPTPVFVADLAITELARDPSAEVRAALVPAVRNHFHEDPESFARVAAQLSADPDDAVRKAAHALRAFAAV